jgi:hypothetical protein
MDGGGDDHPSSRYLVTNDLGREVLALGDALHLGRDGALAGEVHLRAALGVGLKGGALAHGDLPSLA